MSEAKAQASNEDHEAERIYWPRFLESQPPGQSRKITGVAQPHPTGTADLVVLPVQLYCDSEECSGLRYFDSASSGSLNPANAWHKQFLDYRCRHCKKTMKIYAVLVLRNTTGRDGEAVKVGEWPPFGPHVPTKMFSLIGQDQELFLKGRRAESQGMGIGAFAYYRRVVENQKNRLLDEIIKVCQRLNADANLITNLETARKETQFSKAIDIVKDGIPDVLRINGHNPLTLLHTALSDGLHEQSDEERSEEH